jgi:hypothetical protein
VTRHLDNINNLHHHHHHSDESFVKSLFYFLFEASLVNINNSRRTDLHHY